MLFDFKTHKKLSDHIFTYLQRYTSIIRPENLRRQPIHYSGQMTVQRRRIHSIKQIIPARFVLHKQFHVFKNTFLNPNFVMILHAILTQKLELDNELFFFVVRVLGVC